MLLSPFTNEEIDLGPFAQSLELSCGRTRVGNRAGTRAIVKLPSAPDTMLLGSFSIERILSSYIARRWEQASVRNFELRRQRCRKTQSQPIPVFLDAVTQSSRISELHFVVQVLRSWIYF